MPIGTRCRTPAGNRALATPKTVPPHFAPHEADASGAPMSSAPLGPLGYPGIGILPTSGHPAIGDLSHSELQRNFHGFYEWIRGCETKMRRETWESSRMEDSPSENDGLPINNKVFCQLLVDLAAVCLFNGSFQGWLFGKLTQFMEIQSSSLMNLRLFSLIFLSD